VVYTKNGSHHQPWRTPKVVYTTSNSVHPKWSTPRGVVHTISCGAHQKWPIPRVVVHTKSCSHHQQYSPEVLWLITAVPIPSKRFCVGRRKLYSSSDSSLKTLYVYIHSSQDTICLETSIFVYDLEWLPGGWASTNRDRPWLEGQALIEGGTYGGRDLRSEG